MGFWKKKKESEKKLPVFEIEIPEGLSYPEFPGGSHARFRSRCLMDSLSYPAHFSHHRPIEFSRKMT